MPTPALQTPAPFTRVQRRSDVLSSEIGSDVIILNVETGHYIGLDDVAGDVWRRIAEAVAIDALVAGLAADYDGDPAEIEKDVRRLLSDLAEAHLVVPDP